MNKFYILLAVITLSCGNTVSKATAETQNTEEEELPEALEVQQDMLLGKFQKEDLQQQPFSKWFSPRYEEFTPEPEAMTIIKENIDDYKIKIFMGTWCGDSKREVPKFLKILDKADFDYKDVDMVAVDYNKQTPSKIEEELNIQWVPTIIFYKNGEEVNRFVEYSQGESIEEDIAKIVSVEKYKNSYAD